MAYCNYTFQDNYWAKDIFGFYTVPGHPHVLCGWIQEQGAQQMEIVDYETVLEVCFELLNLLEKRILFQDPVMSQSEFIFLYLYLEIGVTFSWKKVNQFLTV